METWGPNEWYARPPKMFARRLTASREDPIDYIRFGSSSANAGAASDLGRLRVSAPRPSRTG